MKFIASVVVSIFVAATVFGLSNQTTNAGPSTNGLIAHWSMDQNSGSVLVDDSGNGWGGSLSGSPTWTSGMIDNGLLLNGNDSVDFGNLNAVNGVPQLSISAWMKRNSPSSKVLLGKQVNGHDVSVEFWDDGYLYFMMGNGGLAGARVQLNDTQWHHIVMVYNGLLSGNQNRLRAFIDGAEVPLFYGGTIPSTTTTNTTNFRLGRIGSSYSNGLIDDVWIYNRAISQSEVATLNSYFIDTTPPTDPSSLTAGTVSHSSVELSWTESTDAVGVEGYKVFRDGSEIGTTTTPSYVDESLTAETAYVYAVSAFDAAGNESATAELTVTTVAEPNAPTVTLEAAPSAVPFGSSTSLSWNVSDADSCEASGDWSGTKPLAGNEQINTVVSELTFTLECSGIGGTSSQTVVVSVVDNEPPTSPANVEGASLSHDEIQLSWDTATDNVGVAGYNVFRDGSLVTSVTETSFTDIGLTAETAYEYWVTAFDSSANESTQSVAVTVTTQSAPSQPTVTLTASASDIETGESVSLQWSSVHAETCTGSGDWSGAKSLGGTEDITLSETGSHTFELTCTNDVGSVAAEVSVNAADTTPPTDPSSLTAGTVSHSSVELSWTESTDAVGVEGYKVFRDGSEIGTTTTPSYVDESLTAETAYVYAVSAFDAAGNESATAELTVTTVAEPTFSTLADAPTKGPLQISDNRLYFEDNQGKAKLLTGSHNWLSQQVLTTDAGPMPFDYDEYLDYLVDNNHNFFRLWTYEQASGWTGATVDFKISPTIYERTGPGLALDGEEKFDLTKFNQEFFDNMRARVIAAQERGIYVSIMLFNGFSVNNYNNSISNPCTGHPLNGSNNINGVDAENNGACGSAHTLTSPLVTQTQEAYVQKVIETVGDLDNVLYEISNESADGSEAWQNHMISFIKTEEASRALQHPVGMTNQYHTNDINDLATSLSDWMSPSHHAGYKTNPPQEHTGYKVIISDTDHLWGVGGDSDWVWKTVTRGMNPIYMDCYDITTDVCSGVPGSSAQTSAVASMGVARELLEQVDLNSMTSQMNLSSTKYVLAHVAGQNSEYVVYRSGGWSKVTLNMSGASGQFKVDWIHPVTGNVVSGGTVTGGSTRMFTPPFSGRAVMHVYSAN